MDEESCGFSRLRHLQLIPWSMMNNTEFRCQKSRLCAEGTGSSCSVLSCMLLSLSALFILPLWNTVYLPASILHNSQLSTVFTCLTARYAICLPACSCALAQFACQLARMLKRCMPACLIINIFCSLSVCLFLCILHSVSA
jgi:hypothetical protein